jgi:hypothetical protein
MAKPNMKQLMDATGVDAATASSMLYGVVGANNDVRDWGSIMSASDPLSAARQATFQMYASPEATEKTRTSGNYASIVPSSGAPSIVRYTDPDSEKTSFAIVAADGTPLRAGFSTEEQARNQGADFGITGSVATGQYLAPRPVSPLPVAQPVAPPPVFSHAVFQLPPAPRSPVAGAVFGGVAASSFSDAATNVGCRRSPAAVSATYAAVPHAALLVAFFVVAATGQLPFYL